MVRKDQQKQAEAVSPVIGVILMVAITVILAAVIGTFVLGIGSQVQETPRAGITTDQAPGEVKITIIDGGNIDGAQLVAPGGTKSTVLSEGLEAGSIITLRSNASVFTFLDEDNISIPTSTGGSLDTAQISQPSDVPASNELLSFGAPEGTNYNDDSAYLACLFDHPGFTASGQRVPSNVSIPCHSPILAQESDVVAGSSVEVGGGVRTRPVVLQEGTYRLIGRLDGDDGVIQNIEVSEDVAP